MSKSNDPLLSRRRVFAGAGTAGALAAAATLMPVSPPASVAVDADAGKPAPDTDGRYQVTQHVLRYYQTAKV